MVINKGNYIAQCKKGTDSMNEEKIKRMLDACYLGTAPGTAGRSHTSVYTVHGCDPQVTGEERESKSIGYQ